MYRVQQRHFVGLHLLHITFSLHNNRKEIIFQALNNNLWVRFKSSTTMNAVPADLFIGFWLSSIDDGSLLTHALCSMVVILECGKVK